MTINIDNESEWQTKIEKVRPSEIICSCFTCSEVEDNVTKEYRVRDDIEYDSTHGQIVIEKGNSNRKYDEISNEKQQHANVPVEPKHWKIV